MNGRAQPVSSRTLHPDSAVYREDIARISHLLNADLGGRLREGCVGLEKEALRMDPDGGIARTSHPAALGSALTHSWITTDYSEALLELITPPCRDPLAALAFLKDIHRFVVRHIGDERLWAASMPCVLGGDEGIPVARYGDSNAGCMKHIYRVGLGHRYGRMMQVIAGVHYNFSLSDALWGWLHAIEGGGREPRAFRDGRQFDAIRNLLRLGWIVPYLFGASPAACKSFFTGRESGMSELDDCTAFEPWGTSLRMSDIGYQNRKEAETGVQADYNSLAGYVASLERAIHTPSPAYERIGVLVGEEYRQLNANLLQIENEYYSTVRPKQPPSGNERPMRALSRRGVEYLELRSLDLDPFSPIGVNESQLRFLHTFLLFCLFCESPPVDAAARAEIDHNLGVVARRGREPGVILLRGGQEIPLADWARGVLDAMQGIVEALDTGMAERPHAAALAAQYAKIGDAALTPSAQVLQEMKSRGEGFQSFVRRLSEQHHRTLLAEPPDPVRERIFEQEAKASIERQREIELAQRDEPFEEYLARYFA